MFPRKQGSVYIFISFAYSGLQISPEFIIAYRFRFLYWKNIHIGNH